MYTVLIETINEERSWRNIWSYLPNHIKASYECIVEKESYTVKGIACKDL